MKNRTAVVNRRTTETSIKLKLGLDGTGRTRISTGIAFFDHMLELLARHASIDLEVGASGDLDVDYHHTVEDIGICFGEALKAALGEKKGIRRFGSAWIPMDEALASAAIDLCGRGLLVYRVKMRRIKIGDFNTALAREFFRAVADHAFAVVHLDLSYGDDPHHCLEAVFKACGRALRSAVEKDPR
nr:imidazoleglycerol-phosphate dehydratase HisB [bacterium]